MSWIPSKCPSCSGGPVTVLFISRRPGKQSDGETVNVELRESTSDIVLYLTGFEFSSSGVTTTPHSYL